MPRTHVLIGFCVAAVINLFLPLAWWHFLLAGFVAAIIDLDHVINFWRVKGELSVQKAWNTAFEHLGFERSFLHRKYGILFFMVVSSFIMIFSPVSGVIVFCAALSHWLFDHTYFRKAHERLVKVGHWLYPISFEELTLDMVFIFLSLVFLMLNNHVAV